MGFVNDEQLGALIATAQASDQTTVAARRAAHYARREERNRTSRIGANGLAVSAADTSAAARGAALAEMCEAREPDRTDCGHGWDQHDEGART